MAQYSRNSFKFQQIENIKHLFKPIKAEKISAKYPKFTDEEIFQSAKNEVVWAVQKIFYEDWSLAMFGQTPDKIKINSKLRLDLR